MNMTDEAERFWALTRAISEAPSDPHELRMHLLDAHGQDAEVVPSHEQLAGLQALHRRLHAAGASHSHAGIQNGSGVTPFADGGVASAGPREQYRCRRCGQMKDRGSFVMGSWPDGYEGQLSCRACFDSVLAR